METCSKCGEEIEPGDVTAEEIRHGIRIHLFGKKFELKKTLGKQHVDCRFKVEQR